MIKIIKLIIVIVLLVNIVTSKTDDSNGNCDWNYCGYDNPPLKVKSINMFPSNPFKGSNISITSYSYFGDNNNQELVGGNSKITLKFGMVDVLIENQQLSNIPIQSDTYNNNTVNFKLPVNSLSGYYNVIIINTDNDNKFLSCVVVDFKL